MMSIGLNVEDYLHQYGDELGYKADELLNYEHALSFLSGGEFKQIEKEGILICKEGLYHKCKIYDKFIVTSYEDIENDVEWNLTYSKNSIVCNALFAKEFRLVLDEDFIKSQIIINTIQDLQLSGVEIE